MIAFAILVPFAGMAGGDAPEGRPKYAKGFSIEAKEGYELLSIIREVPGENPPQRYVILGRDAENPRIEGAVVIRKPVKKVAVLVGSYLAHLDILDRSDSVIAISNVRHIYSPEYRLKVKEKIVIEVGSAEDPDIEKLIEAGPDVVLSYSTGKQGLRVREQLHAAGIPVIFSGSWLEETPLGRAEWMKVTAALVDCGKEAELWFNDLCKRYNDLRELAANRSPRPTVLVGAPFKGVWHVPGGRSFTAGMIDDAGGRYLWNQNPSTGSVPADIEAVLALGMHAKVWINPSDWRSLREGRKRLSRAKVFQAFDSGQVFNNDARVNKWGGNDIWFSGFVQPDIVLKDLISIFHPDLLPGHEFVYYRQLK